MNALSCYVLLQFEVTLPSYADDVYLAFDEGEYKHAEDGGEVDPREKYMWPRIESLVIRDQVLG